MSPPCGGQFLLAETDPSAVFTPEEFTSEQRAVAQAANAFIDGEVLPRVAALESHEPGLAPALLRSAAELGLLAVDTPPEFGGLGLDVISSSLVSEAMGRQGSWAVCIGAHAGIGTLPLIYFGNQDQKRRYLPRLARGELLGAYALSETGSGSDALAARTRAVLSADGTYYELTGEKMWISNGGFADLFTVFAQVDGNQFSAFLVERGFPGVSTGREEHKLGIRGSSTTRLILDHAQVPLENLLYTVGRGHVVALNILNLGRYKLAVGMLGAAKEALRTAVRYAQERRQFGKAIVEFGLMREKLARMAMRLLACESACYRLGGVIQQCLETNESDRPTTDSDLPHKAQVLEEYLIECALLKVHASEMLDFVVDEAMQIHGGYGYTEEFPVARMVRDARINRIFEGTNEINRLAMVVTLIRRVKRGRLSLTEASSSPEETVLIVSSPGDPAHEVRRHVALARRLLFLALGLAAITHDDRLAEEQEVCGLLADGMIELFVAESAACRSIKTGDPVQCAAAQVIVVEALQRIQCYAESVAAACLDEAGLRAWLERHGLLLRRRVINAVLEQRRVADLVVARGGYPWA